MGATKLNFSHQAIWTSIFKVLYDLDLKSKVASLNGDTLEIPSDIHHIREGGSFSTISTENPSRWVSYKPGVTLALKLKK